MKFIVICALVAAASAYESDGIHGKSNYISRPHLRDPYTHLLRSRPIIQTCTPGSVKKIDCYDCECSESGHEWSCTLKDCVQTPPVHKVEDGLIAHSDQANRLVRSRRDAIAKECDKEGDTKQTGCYTCYCDSQGYYSICIAGVQCDLDNSDRSISGAPNVGKDFNVDSYVILP